REKLEEKDLSVGPLFGFNNTYVLATRPGLNFDKISDLRDRSDLRFGFSNEFTQREDGFIGVNEAYNLGLDAPRGLDHGLAYKALADGSIDVTDAYSTDGKLRTFGFQLLEDDRDFFPPYYAFPLIRGGTANRYPELLEALSALENQLDEEAMRALNYRYEVAGEDLATIAFDFLKEKEIVEERPESAKMHPIVKQTIDHIELTLLATLLAVILAVPMGIAIIGKKRLANVVMSTTGAIQTIPSLALLGFMIPLFGIGFLPAVIALFLYALLPILRNTYTGLQETDPILIEAARAMGMTPTQILFQLRLPLASDVIMAGIRTALTINIGTATLAAFIGAGGLGESIITGITLNDNEMILQGAVPAALLALMADRLMLLLQKKLTPKRA
ncbi:MAG TPA: glycine betaine ABC transporter substrate-binding protein, partial [Cryomorphaceae bacterium]|nr:glycine betaine ABC transporter substrate-binding protein [Cryomorphaceae bacterium]